MSSLAPTTTPTDDTLRTQAAQQVDASIKASTDPLYRQTSDLQAREQQSIGQIGGMFDQLQPIVGGEADAVQSSFDTANNASKSIFEAAQQRMDQLRQQRANEAQALSQQIGGPVAVNEFTAAVDPSQNQLASVAPNQLLHGLANAQAGTQQARAFSERVFPAMRTEQIANARNTFESQINDLRQQIDQITGQRGTLIDQKFTDLQAAQRDWDLKQAQLKLDQLKADRDWQAAQHQMANDDKRLRITQGQLRLQTAGVTGKLGGKPTLAAIKVSNQAIQAANKLGMTKAQLQETIRSHMANEANASKRLQISQRSKAMTILDHALGFKSGSVSFDQRREIPMTQALSPGMRKNPHLSYVSAKNSKDGRDHWYLTQPVHLTQAQFAAQYGSGYGKNPQNLYDLLIGSNIPKAIALKVTRDRTLIQDFVPGKPVVYSASDLKAIGQRSFQELRGIAVQRGWKPNARQRANPSKWGATTGQLVDFILSTQKGM